MSGCRVGIDLGGTKIEGVRLEGEARLVERIRVETPQGNYSETVRTVAKLVDALCEGQPWPVGIGTPGVEQRANGLMKNCNSTCLNGQPLRADLEQRIGRPVRMANDANCFALAEAMAGAGQGAGLVFGIILGTGVGGGLVVNNKLVVGPSGLAGEWGHSPLPGFRFANTSSEEQQLADRACYCGQINCIETFLSGPGLARTYAELHGGELSPERIGQADDARSRLVMELYFDWLARSLAAVVNVMDPDVIVAGGGLSNLAGLYEPVNARLPSAVFSGECVARLVPPVGGDAVGAVGAAWLWPVHED